MPNQEQPISPPATREPDLPPTPPVSGDGRFWWDGQRWQSFQNPQTSTESAGPQPLLRHFWTYGLPAIPIIGLLVYGVLRQLYAGFYGALGASPEEVGLGYSETLSLSGIGLIILLLPSAFVLTVGWLIPGWQWPGVIRTARVTGGIIAVLLLGALALLGWQTYQARDSAYRGYAVRSVNLSLVQVLGLRAEPATVSWTKNSEPPDPPFHSGQCFLYLGSANGRAVFFDPGPQNLRTIRVAESSVIISVIRAQRDPVTYRDREIIRCVNQRSVFD